MFDAIRPQAQPLKLPHCVIDSDYYQCVRYIYFKNIKHYWLDGQLNAHVKSTMIKLRQAISARDGRGYYG